MKHALLLSLPLLLCVSCVAPHAHHHRSKVVVKPVKHYGPHATLRFSGGVWVRR
ncbi:MAG: hypothetical protein MK291_01215 [Planctomycetes bacterium]|nr:hypothetical protein [Planctomycetota bacterium]